MRRSGPLGVIASVVLAAAVVNPGPAAAKPDPRPVAGDDRAVILEDTVLRLARPGVLANDHGTGRLRADVLAEPRRASLRLGARGGLRLRPDADVNGTVRFAYRAVDTRGRADRAVVRVEVVPVNDAPSFTPGPDQVVAADAGTQVVAGWATDVEAGAPDERDQQLTFEVDEVSDADLFAAGGLPAVSADGVLTYTPAPGAHGTATARVLLTDDGGVADGGSDTSGPASLRITVSPPAVPPVARPGTGDTTVIAGGTSVLLAPAAEVVDPDSELVRATVTVPGGLVLSGPTTDGITASYDTGTGRLELAGAASDAAYQRALRSVAVRATATAAAGPRRVLIELEDADGLTGRAERDVRVEAAAPPADVPTVTVADVVTIDEDTDATGNVLANDTDPDDTLTVASHTAPAHGTLTLGTGGAFTYTPDPDWNGTETLTYTTNTGATGTLEITVTPISDAPVAHDDTLTGDEDSVVTGNVLGNDTDPDGDPVSAALVAGPSHGTLTLDTDGSVTYTPSANFHGTDSFTYRADDGSLQSDVATATLTVDPVNDPPVAVADSYVIDEDDATSFDVLANDTDPDGDPLVAVVVTDPAHGLLGPDPDGTLTYTPDANFHGSDSFTYRVDDGDLSSSTVTVTVTVEPVNDAPVAHDDSYRTAGETPFAGDVIANDVDADGDSLVAALVTPPAHGTLVLNPSGSMTYTPDPGYRGTDSFAYAASDGHGSSDTATVSIRVDDPTVAATDAVTVAEDTDATGNVLANDTDPDDTLTVTSHTDPTHGTLTLGTGGAFTYTPEPDWHGTETLTYTTNTGATGTLEITVTPVNDAPVAHDDSFTIDEDTTWSLPFPLTALTTNDTDVDGDTLTVYMAAAPVNGSLAAVGGNLVFTPTTDYSGPASFTYGVHDGHGATAIATVNITVTAVDDPTIAVTDTITVAEDTQATGNVLTNDIDPDDALSVTSHTDAHHGTLAIQPNGDLTYTPDPDWHGTETLTYTTNTGATGTLEITVTPVNDAPVAHDDSFTIDEDTTWSLPFPLTALTTNDTDVDGDTLTVYMAAAPVNGSLAAVGGNLVFTPTTDYSGPASFTYGVHDGHGATAIATVNITVTAVDDPTVAATDAVTVAEDTDATGNVLANDTDPDDTLTVTNHTDPGIGTLVIDPDGTFTYTPEPDWNGTVPLITYTTNTGANGTLAITVTPVDDAP